MSFEELATLKLTVHITNQTENKHIFTNCVPTLDVTGVTGWLGLVTLVTSSVGTQLVKMCLFSV
jgi:hypothetical protein